MEFGTHFTLTNDFGKDFIPTYIVTFIFICLNLAGVARICSKVFQGG